MTDHAEKCACANCYAKALQAENEKLRLKLDIEKARREGFEKGLTDAAKQRIEELEAKMERLTAIGAPFPPTVEELEAKLAMMAENNQVYELALVSEALLGCKNGTLKQMLSRVQELEAKLALMAEAAQELIDDFNASLDYAVRPTVIGKLRDASSSTAQDVAAWRKRERGKVIDECASFLSAVGLFIACKALEALKGGA